MTDKIVRFSRLLRVFELNDKPAYIIELDYDGKKILYISYTNKRNGRSFEAQSKTVFTNEFKQLSEHCLMSECKKAYSMFYRAPITHFETDCPSLIDGDSMFYHSQLKFIKAKFPLIKNDYLMFSFSKLEQANLTFSLAESTGTAFKYTSTKFKKDHPHYFV